MLEFYIESEFRLRQFRECATGEYMDCFADWLQSDGYRRRPAQLLLRSAAHLGEWASIEQVRVDQFDEAVLDSFSGHLTTCACTHPFRGRDRRAMRGANRFVEYLQSRGIVPVVKLEAQGSPALVETFSDWMRRHRGTTESTIALYAPIVKEFLGACGADTAQYDATLIRKFILVRASHSGQSRAQSVANAIRMFLRFLATYAYCPAEIIGAVPKLAHWKLSSLPRYISAQDTERVVAVCDPDSHVGSRDRAIMLLLARLALRAGDVRDLRLQDIDWTHSRLRVVGKGRWETRLPLPQDVGDAVLHYLDHFRPNVDDDHVFLRICAPFGPIRSSSAISCLVRRALRKAGIQAPSTGAHLLRHSSATTMLRQGLSLDVIGAVLRHRSVESTAHYAKVDLPLLHSVVQPWPDKEGSSC
jgi:integrase